MSFPRRSSFSPGRSHAPSPLSQSCTTASHRRSSSSTVVPSGICTGFFVDSSPEGPLSPRAISPSSTVRPHARRASFSASSPITSQPPSQPIAISPRSSLHGSAYLAQRQSNLEWALRHNDAELIRTERAAIERHKQEVAERSGFHLDEAANSEGTASVESFEIPIQDTSQAPASSGVRYGTGRRMSCLATYTGLPVPQPLGEPSSYSVALEGGYPYAPPTSTSPTRTSPFRRPPSPYRSSSGIVPLSPLFDPDRQRSPDSRIRPRISSSISDPTGSSLHNTLSTEGLSFSRRGESSSSSSSTSSLVSPTTRIIHGFHIDCPPSSPDPASPTRQMLSSPSPSPPPPPPPPAPATAPVHAISRGRAGSIVSFVGGLGSGNYQQERMELQASRDIEVLDRPSSSTTRRASTSETRRGRKSGEGGGGGGGGGELGVEREGRKGRSKEGKAAAAERLRKGYYHACDMRGRGDLGAEG